MDSQRQIVSISLSKKSFYLLNQICKKEEKSRSEVVKNLIRSYVLKKEWNLIFDLGKKTKKKFKIKTEADILKMIND